MHTTVNLLKPTYSSTWVILPDVLQPSGNYVQAFPLGNQADLCTVCIQFSTNNTHPVVYYCWYNNMVKMRFKKGHMWWILSFCGVEGHNSHWGEGTAAEIQIWKVTNGHFYMQQSVAFMKRFIFFFHFQKLTKHALASDPSTFQYFISVLKEIMDFLLCKTHHLFQFENARRGP